MPPEAESRPADNLPGGPAFPEACPFFAQRFGPAPVSVLCVDDDPDLLVVTRLVLEQDGSIAVTTCPSPDLAFDLVQRTTFDLIVSDYNMPGMTGVGLFEKLREAGCRTPFFLFTGHDASAVPGLSRVLDANADAYITKSPRAGSPFRHLRETILRHAGRESDPARQ
ncbi:MAG: response regulator [Methanoregula sp.]|jgi:CheY-like chemotaxis protein